MKETASQFASQFAKVRRSSDCDATNPLRYMVKLRSVAVSASQSSRFSESRESAGRRSSAAARVSPPYPLCACARSWGAAQRLSSRGRGREARPRTRARRTGDRTMV